MADYAPIKFELKSGVKVVIRSAKKADSKAIFELSKSVISEEVWHLTALSEFNTTVEENEKWISAHNENPNHLILVAEVNSKIVGSLDFSNGHRQRIAHTGRFGISVEQSFRGQGIGGLLVKALLDWATQTKTIEKIELSVHANNERAIALYKKMGFEIEGVKRRQLKYSDGQYIDTVLMGRFV